MIRLTTKTATVVATNSKGHVFVYTRSANTRLFEFDQNGTYVREIGEGNYGFEFAHSVRVDSQDALRQPIIPLRLLCSLWFKPFAPYTLLSLSSRSSPPAG